MINHNKLRGSVYMCTCVKSSVATSLMTAPPTHTPHDATTQQQWASPICMWHICDASMLGSWAACLLAMALKVKARSHKRPHCAVILEQPQEEALLDTHQRNSSTFRDTNICFSRRELNEKCDTTLISVWQIWSHSHQLFWFRLACGCKKRQFVVNKKDMTCYLWPLEMLVGGFCDLWT